MLTHADTVIRVTHRSHIPESSTILQPSLVPSNRVAAVKTHMLDEELAKLVDCHCPSVSDDKPATTVLAKSVVPGKETHIAPQIVSP